MSRSINNKTTKTVSKKAAPKGTSPKSEATPKDEPQPVDVLAEQLRTKPMVQAGPAKTWTVTEADVRAGAASPDAA